mgnify:CR=1 FL=1
MVFSVNGPGPRILRSFFTRSSPLILMNLSRLLPWKPSRPSIARVQVVVGDGNVVLFEALSPDVVGKPGPGDVARAVRGLDEQLRSRTLEMGQGEKGQNDVGVLEVTAVSREKIVPHTDSRFRTRFRYLIYGQSGAAWNQVVAPADQVDFRITGVQGDLFFDVGHVAGKPAPERAVTHPDTQKGRTVQQSQLPKIHGRINLRGHGSAGF